MIAASMHRGPDASGSVEIPLATPSLVLGHTRLSILDLSYASGQPMHDLDSGSWLIFNGEIYNFRQLRSDLETLGAKFSTSGDTEVLLRALVQWGEAALNKLDGMFAFAFWDGRERNLLLARDRMGVKPLYYCRAGRDFAFASEVKALERAQICPLTLDRRDRAEYHLPRDPRTGAGAPPAHSQRWSGRRLRVLVAQPQPR
jgi:asparagine synthase (glutamine-hydrolysing)